MKIIETLNSKIDKLIHDYEKLRLENLSLRQELDAIKNENDEEDTIIDKQEELREHTAILQEKLKYHKNEIANLLEYLDLPKDS